MNPGPDEIEVEVVGVFERRTEVGDQEQRIPVLILKDPAGRELCLPIETCEGLAIHIAIEQQIIPRPLTHDLALRILARLSAQIDRVLIDDLSGRDSHATIHLRASAGDLSVGGSPGDAVALALRAEVPVYVTEGVLAQAARMDEDTH